MCTRRLIWARRSQNELTQTGNPKTNLCYNGHFKKLDIFWLKTNCNKKRKLLVYNAVITSKLVYGLETLEPTASAEKILNTFQLKGLRKILQLHTTFNTRSNTNEYVYNRANEVTNAPSLGIHRKIKPLTEVLGERRLKLLGHVLCRDRQHPLHQTRETEQRRVGRPRQFWTTANMEKAWNIITSKDVSVPKVPFNQHDRAIRETIIDHARRYQPPFH